MYRGVVNKEETRDARREFEVLVLRVLIESARVGDSWWETFSRFIDIVLISVYPPVRYLNFYLHLKRKQI